MRTSFTAVDDADQDQEKLNEKHQKEKISFYRISGQDLITPEIEPY